MALGDGVRRNLSTVDPAERTMLRDAILELHKRYYPGSKTDPLPGGVSWWVKLDEIHQATHVHGGPEFLPWHREIVNHFTGWHLACSSECWIAQESLAVDDSCRTQVQPVRV